MLTKAIPKTPRKVTRKISCSATTSIATLKQSDNHTLNHSLSLPNMVINRNQDIATNSNTNIPISSTTPPGDYETGRYIDRFQCVCNPIAHIYGHV